MMNELLLVCLCAFVFFGFVTLLIRYYTHQNPISLEPTSVDVGIMEQGGSSRSVSVQGLHPEDIKTLPVFSYLAFKELPIGKGSKVECPVCLGEFSEDEFIKLLPKCDHAFHSTCIESWLMGSGTCPVCRTDLTAQSSRHGEKDEEIKVVIDG